MNEITKTKNKNRSLFDTNLKKKITIFSLKKFMKLRTIKLRNGGKFERINREMFEKRCLYRFLFEFLYKREKLLIGSGAKIRFVRDRLITDREAGVSRDICTLSYKR